MNAPAAASSRTFKFGGFPMTDAVKVGFVPFSTAPKGVLVVFTDESMKFGPASRKLLAGAEETIKRAAAASDGCARTQSPDLWVV